MAVDKLVDSSQLDSDLTSVANAIRAKTGGSSQIAFPSGFVSGIGGLADPSGTTATASDVAQGKYFLTSAGVLTEGTSSGGGGLYPWWNTPDPTDGKTHIWIEIPYFAPVGRRDFVLRFTQSKANGVTVDWGDGSATETYSGTTATNHTHTYPSSGKFEITLTVTSGTVSFTGNSSNSICGYILTGALTFSRRTYIKRIFFGNNTSIGNYSLFYCQALEKTNLPSILTAMPQYSLEYCAALTSLTIPSGVTSLGSYAFGYCGLMAEFHFLSTTVPTLGNTNTFSNIPTDCKFYVPKSENQTVLNAYKTANNWSDYADRILEEP